MVKLMRQTHQEEISLPAKEFRAILVKMIKNLENKMEEQINRLEAQIKNILEMFHKDLE